MCVNMSYLEMWVRIFSRAFWRAKDASRFCKA
jgi:hypothetical protein